MVRIIGKDKMGNKIFVILVFTLQIFLVLFFFKENTISKNSTSKTVTRINDVNLKTDTNSKNNMDIRNQISRHLNDVLMKYGQINCELNELKGKQLITNSGGWCRKDSAPDSKNHRTDKPLAYALSQLFKGKAVASFGDGPGLYKQIFDKTEKLLKYDAYDGAPFCEEVTDGRVKFLDLTAPQYGLPVYDWVISLEVAEHIPPAYEQIYLDNIFRHAKEGIVLSWAVPNQSGLSHVNNKGFEDVKELIEKGGFKWDVEASAKLKKNASVRWLKGNTNVYVRTKAMNLSQLA